jgi:hypothetical protein
MSDNLSGQAARLDKIRSKRAIVVYNERTKLLASAFDRASTAVLSIGVLAPIGSGIYGLGLPIPWERLTAWFVIWVICGCMLHLVARRILGELT